MVSGLSVERYRGTTKSYRQVGEELGVAYILEGSVQRSGSRVRVAGRLVDARNESQVWAKSLEREVRERGGWTLRVRRQLGLFGGGR